MAPVATSAPRLELLSSELLRLVLDFIEPDPDRTVPVDRRQFLSVESFDFPPPSARDSLEDIGRFRLTCKRFAELGEPLLSTRVAARFSTPGLKRLDQLADWPHLARHVKKFSYLLPYFFYGNNGVHQLRGLLQQQERDPAAGDAAVPQPPHNLDLSSFNNKAREQRRLMDSKEDLRVLKRAVAAFTSLQHVQILRVLDAEDTALMAYMRHHDRAHQHMVDLAWAPACLHGSRTVGAALLASDSPWSRFSSPMLSPQSAEFLATNRPPSLPMLAERLTCLTLHFDDGSDLDHKMMELSGLFRTVFTAATNMQVVHVGFPGHRPLALPLEAVFHNVKWDKLVAFGVQGWKLDAHEILNLALRHRERLKGLRLRDVLLRDGSMWRDVLEGLRSSMYQLEWVSLRRIGYAKHFDDLWMAAGAEVPDDPPPGEESDSDSGVDDDYDPVAGPSTWQNNHVNGLDGHHPASDSLDDIDQEEGTPASTDSDEDDEDDDEDEYGPQAHEMDFPPLDASSPMMTPASTVPWCNCDCDNNNNANGRALPDGLDDDGYSVSNAKRKAWERWIVRRCPEHDSK